MEHEISVAVIGGDRRLTAAAERLARHGISVRAFGLEAGRGPAADSLAAAAEAEALLFGLPFSRDGETVFAPFGKDRIPIKEICGLLEPRHTVFAGKPDAKALAEMRASGANVIDYTEDEAFTQANAAITAEALAGLLIITLPCALNGANIAISGFGRIGKKLTESLLALGADVTVFARSEEQQAKAASLGAQALPFTALQDRCGRFRALVNTVPAPVIGFAALENLPVSCLLLEAASAPYGIDADAARRMGFPYQLASALPGKYAPETAGEAIADAVYRRLREVRLNGTP